MIKKFIGVVLIIAGLVLGVYLGLWVMFVGGIEQIIDGVQAEPDANGGDIAWGIVRIFFAGAIGTITAVIIGGIGGLFLSDD
jgi:hypothetical protein